jgi:DNA-binding NtrC family response regulator
VKHILIVDDERGSRESLKAIFSGRYDLSIAENADEATRLLTIRPVDLVLLDVMMPGRDGLTLLRDIQASYPDVPVIMVSASNAVQPVVDAIRTGATDFVTKPFDVEEIRRRVQKTIETNALQRNVKALQQDVQREYPVDGIMGRSTSFQRALSDARKAAESDATILITGESGTGKELVARSIHAWSSRRDEPFVAVHCAALPEALIESELFGHEKGAFTSADRQKPGRFDLAGSGSLFFDEVSEMPLSTQVKLLRVLQEKEFMRVGGTKIIRTEARIIAATGKDLRTEVQAKRFRDDLFYRLSVVPVRLPPLRDREGDVGELIQFFFQFYRRKMAATTEGFSEAAMQLMERYSWPGNVRELKNIIERMLVLHGKAPTILPEFLPEEFGSPLSSTEPPAPPTLSAPIPSLEPAATATAPSALPPTADAKTLEDAVNAFERELIARALSEAGGIQTRAAQALGTTRRILKYRMEKLSIRAGDDPDEPPP